LNNLSQLRICLSQCWIYAPKKNLKKKWICTFRQRQCRRSQFRQLRPQSNPRTSAKTADKSSETKFWLLEDCHAYSRYWERNLRVCPNSEEWVGMFDCLQEHWCLGLRASSKVRTPRSLYTNLSHKYIRGSPEFWSSKREITTYAIATRWDECSCTNRRNAEGIWHPGSYTWGCGKEDFNVSSCGYAKRCLGLNEWLAFTQAPRRLIWMLWHELIHACTWVISLVIFSAGHPIQIWLEPATMLCRLDSSFSDIPCVFMFAEHSAPAELYDVHMVSL